MSLQNKLKSRNEKENPGIAIIAALLIMYILSGILLLLLAFLLFKMELSEMFVKAAVIVIYVAAGLVGGIFVGKRLKDRKFLWGLLTGSIYFLLLVIFSAFFSRGFQIEIDKVITTWILCGASAMVGGMIS